MATGCKQYEECTDKNQFEEKFSCSICLGKYVKPRTLPCSHTFCHSCIVESLRGVINNQRFCCPYCRTDAKVDTSAKFNAENIVERFPIDFNLIQKMKTATINTDPETDSNFCKPCLRVKTYEPASVYCCDCSEILCSDCKKHHSKNKLTTNHAVVDIKGDMSETRRLNFVKNLTKCKNHPLEEVKYLCKDHDQLCCNECAILSHRKCQTLQSLGDSLSSDVQKCVIENQKTMEKHVEHMKMHEANNKKSVCNSEIMIKDQLLCIKAEFDHAFRVFEENTLKEVKSKCNGLRNSVSSQEMGINRFEADLKYSKEKISSVEQYGQDLHMYLMERELEEEMEQNEQVLKSLHQNISCSEVLLTGVETISKKLKTCLNQNLAVTVNRNTSALPKYPTLKRTRNITSANYFGATRGGTVNRGKHVTRRYTFPSFSNN